MVFLWLNQDGGNAFAIWHLEVKSSLQYKNELDQSDHSTVHKMIKMSFVHLSPF